MSSFQIWFSIIAPMVVSILMYIFIEPLIKRTKLRQSLAGDLPIINLEYGKLMVEDQLKGINLQIQFVNKTDSPIILKKAYFIFNKKVWGLYKYERFWSEEKAIEPKYSKYFDQDFNKKYFEEMKNVLDKKNITLEKKLLRMKIVFEDIENNRYEKKVSLRKIQIIKESYDEVFNI